jgi:hypothetical protein
MAASSSSLAPRAGLALGAAALAAGIVWMRKHAEQEKREEAAKRCAAAREHAAARARVCAS